MYILYCVVKVECVEAKLDIVIQWLQCLSLYGSYLVIANCGSQPCTAHTSLVLLLVKEHVVFAY